MAIRADNYKIGSVALCISQNDVGDWLAARLHRFNDYLGSMTSEIVSHIRARLLAVAGILLRIDHEDGNGLGVDEKRKRICYRASRLTAGIPGDHNMVDCGPSPGLWQQEERHSSFEEKFFG